MYSFLFPKSTSDKDEEKVDKTYPITEWNIKEVIPEEPKITIEEIHEAFYNKVDELLAMCQIQKDESSEIEELIKKHDRLSKLGFSNSSIAKKCEYEKKRIEGIKRENQSKQNLINVISYFKQKYPHYKFISTAGVNELCKKYGFIYADASFYKGNIPDKNLKEMENFKIEKEDKTYIKIDRGMRRNREDLTDWADYKFYADSRQRTVNNFLSPYDVQITFGTKPFQVVATKDEFHIENMELKGYELKRKPVVDEDPIVLQPVCHNSIHGFLIVTAWGPEASDPLVLNENHN